MNLQIHREKHHQNTEPQGSQKVLQNPSLSLAKNGEVMYNGVPKNSQVSNPLQKSNPYTMKFIKYIHFLILRLTPEENGSIIWSSAKYHHLLIQQHSFWEIRNGKSARFWTDSWEQLPKLTNTFNPSMEPEWDTRQLETVNQYWDDTDKQGYRQWKQATRIARNANEQESHAITDELNNRCIRVSHDQDILRWGHTPKGTFST